MHNSQSGTVELRLSNAFEWGARTTLWEWAIETERMLVNKSDKMASNSKENIQRTKSYNKEVQNGWLLYYCSGGPPDYDRNENNVDVS